MKKKACDKIPWNLSFHICLFATGTSLVVFSLGAKNTDYLAIEGLPVEDNGSKRVGVLQATKQCKQKSYS